MLWISSFVMLSGNVAYTMYAFRNLWSFLCSSVSTFVNVSWAHEKKVYLVIVGYIVWCIFINSIPLILFFKSSISLLIFLFLIYQERVGGLVFHDNYIYQFSHVLPTIFAFICWVIWHIKICEYYIFIVDYNLYKCKVTFYVLLNAFCLNKTCPEFNIATLCCVLFRICLKNLYSFFYFTAFFAILLYVYFSQSSYCKIWVCCTIGE